MVQSHRCAGVGHVAEHGFIQKFVAHAAIEAFHEPVLHRFTLRDVMPLDVALGGKGRDRVTGQFGAIVADNDARTATSFDDLASSLATRRPEIEVSGVAARHSRVKSVQF